MIRHVLGRLKAELQERGKFYLQGFGAVLGMGVITGLELFLDDPLNNYLSAEHVRNSTELMAKHYERTSFGEMVDHPDADVLLEIREAVLGLRKVIDVVLSGDFSRGDLAFSYIQTISDLGQIYRNRLEEIQEVLRTKPGFEQAGLRADDMLDGSVWESALG